MPVSPSRRVPFYRPLAVGSELSAVADLIGRRNGVEPDYYTQSCQSMLRQLTGSPAVYLTPSCTQSLEMATLLSGIGPGDEVIMPAFTFVSTANAVVLRGARPVFVDIRPDTCNLDALLIRQAITSSTRAIIPVHYAGVACEMDIIMEIAEETGLVVIEDAAHSVFASWRGRALGSIGQLGAYSFHSTKNLTSGGEGGALLVNAEEFLQQASVVRANGTNRDAFIRGEVSRYKWICPGGNYNMSEVQAAVLWAQLHQGQAITDSRVAAWQYYHQNLGSTCARVGISLPVVPPDCRHNGHIFYALMPSEEARAAIISYLADVGIEALSHYEPLHRSPAGQELGHFFGADEHTSRVASTIIRLPIYHDISRDDQDYVLEHFVRAVRTVF